MATDLQTIKHQGRFPKGRAHKYSFYKKEGIVKTHGTRKILVKESGGFAVGKVPRVRLTKKGNAMYEQLKGVI